MPLDNNILGLGVYTPREAARLLGINAQQILRWTRGSGPNQPLWNAYYQHLDDDITEISFLDLIETRVVAAMRKQNISLQSIRFAIKFAQDKYNIERPLASQKFKADGTEILMSAIEQDGEFVSLSRTRPGQKVFREIINQSLNDIEYDGELVARWRPSSFQEIVLDPARHFGEPILDKFGLSTNIIHREYKEFNDINYLSKIYDVPSIHIQKAIEYETTLDASNG